MTGDSCPRKQDGVLAQQAGEKLLLLNAATGNYYSLDEVGARVWELLDGRKIAEIAAAISQEYDAPSSVESDILELLGDLEREQLIVNGPR
jgi:hypothetical protein